MHINERANMSLFDGTMYEGMTYLQVRRMLTTEQLAKLKQLDKRNRAVAKTAKIGKRVALGR